MDTMSQAEGRLGEEAQLDVYRSQSISFAPPQTPVNYGTQFMAQSWPPQPSAMWNEAYSSQFNWQAAPTAPEILTQESSLYTSEAPNLGSSQYKYEPAASFNAAPSYLQPYVQRVNDVSSDYSPPCPSQTPQAAAQPLYTNIATPDGTDYSHPYPSGTDLHPPMSYDAAWISMGNEPGRNIHADSDPLPDPNAPEIPAKGFVLDWPTNEQVSGPSTASNVSTYQAIIRKRKHASPEPVAKKKSTSTEDELDEFVVVFENAPGALASVKRRRKLDAPVRKAARDVRKAGACHQCRFRKRTVSQQASSRCRSNGLIWLNSVRQVHRAIHVSKTAMGFMSSSVNGRVPSLGSRCINVWTPNSLSNLILTSPDFEYSSTRRVVSFNIRVNAKALKSLEKEMVTIDGVGHLSHPIQLPSRRKALSSFKTDEREIIDRTRDSKRLLKVRDDELEHVLILEDEATLGTQVEQWAVEYSSKFVHAAGPEFASTTAAVILGTAYVNKGLPEVSHTVWFRSTF
jgi:hypothetical protein